MIDAVYQARLADLVEACETLRKVLHDSPIEITGQPLDVVRCSGALGIWSAAIDRFRAAEKTLHAATA